MSRPNNSNTTEKDKIKRKANPPQIAHCPHVGEQLPRPCSLRAHTPTCSRSIIQVQVTTKQNVDDMITEEMTGQLRAIHPAQAPGPARGLKPRTVAPTPCSPFHPGICSQGPTASTQLNDWRFASLVRAAASRPRFSLGSNRPCWSYCGVRSEVAPVPQAGPAPAQGGGRCRERMVPGLQTASLGSPLAVLGLGVPFCPLICSWPCRTCLHSCVNEEQAPGIAFPLRPQALPPQERRCVKPPG